MDKQQSLGSELKKISQHNAFEDISSCSQNTRFNNIIETAFKQRTCNKSTNLRLSFRCTKSNPSRHWASGYSSYDTPRCSLSPTFRLCFWDPSNVLSCNWQKASNNRFLGHWQVLDRRGVPWMGDYVEGCLRGCTLPNSYQKAGIPPKSPSKTLRLE